MVRDIFFLNIFEKGGMIILFVFEKIFGIILVVFNIKNLEMVYYLFF